LQAPPKAVDLMPDLAVDLTLGEFPVGQWPIFAVVVFVSQAVPKAIDCSTRVRRSPQAVQRPEPMLQLVLLCLPDHKLLVDEFEDPDPGAIRENGREVFQRCRLASCRLGGLPAESCP
jgi:hypothetical protein